jgi:hypothetical protein
MVGKQTLIKKPKSTEEPRKFEYDHSYWSFDGFKATDNGYNEPDGTKYSDQVCVCVTLNRNEILKI